MQNMEFNLITLKSKSHGNGSGKRKTYDINVPVLNGDKFYIEILLDYSVWDYSASPLLHINKTTAHTTPSPSPSNVVNWLFTVPYRSFLWLLPAFALPSTLLYDNKTRLQRSWWLIVPLMDWSRSLYLCASNHARQSPFVIPLKRYCDEKIKG